MHIFSVPGYYKTRCRIQIKPTIIAIDYLSVSVRKMIITDRRNGRRTLGAAVCITSRIQFNRTVHQVEDQIGIHCYSSAVSASIAPGIVADICGGGKDQFPSTVPGRQRYGGAAGATCAAAVVVLYSVRAADSA